MGFVETMVKPKKRVEQEGWHKVNAVKMSLVSGGGGGGGGYIAHLKQMKDDKSYSVQQGVKTSGYMKKWNHPKIPLLYYICRPTWYSSKFMLGIIEFLRPVFIRMAWHFTCHGAGVLLSNKQREMGGCFLWWKTTNLYQVLTDRLSLEDLMRKRGPGIEHWCDDIIQDLGRCGITATSSVFWKNIQKSERS